MRRHLLFVLALLIAAPASAQDAEPAEADPAADVPAVDGDAEAEDAEAVPPPEYDARVREALQESAAGHWAEARAAFRQAHEAFPNARTERGMGMVSFEMRDYVDSVRHLRRALDNPVRPLTETQRTEVQALLDRALARIAVFSLESVPEGAQILVDGRAIEPEGDGTLLLPQETDGHAVTVQTDTRRWQSEIPVRGGETGPLPMVFDEPEPREPASSAPPVVIAPPPPEPSPPAGGLALVVGGAAVFLAGVAVLVAGLVELESFNAAGPSTEWADVSGSYAITLPLQGVGYAAIGLGAAMAIGGSVWIATDDGGGDGAGAQLRLRGTF